MRISGALPFADSCAAIRRNGLPCHRPTEVTKPVPLCSRHIEKLLANDDPAINRALRVVNIKMEAERREREERYEQQAEEAGQRLAALAQDVRRASVAQSVVYYAKIGQYVKIGTTINMKRRMAGLAMDAVLATEPGGVELESQRHREFAEFRAIRREYFWPQPRLLDHIEAVRRDHGDPVITTYPRVRNE